MANKKSIKKSGNETVFSLEDIISSNKTVRPGDTIDIVYLKFKSYKTNYWDGVYRGFYYFEICDSHGQRQKISMTENGQNLQKATFSSFQMLISGLEGLMKIIQMNRLFLFSSVSLLVLEEIAKYDKGKDIHYYLKVLLSEMYSK